MQALPTAPGTRLLDIIARAVRAFLEPLWWRQWQGAEAEGVPPSAGMCGRSSLTLQHVLVRDFGIEARWASGTPPSTGLHGTDGVGFLWLGQWVGHAWVEAEGRIVDITADQFGGPPVLVVSSADPRFRVSEENNAAEYRSARERAAEDAWRGWLLSDERASLMRRLGVSARV